MRQRRLNNASIMSLGDIPIRDDVTIEKVINGDKVYLYLDHQKGTEDSITLTFSVKEAKFPKKYYDLYDEDFNKVVLTLSESQVSVLPIKAPKSAEDLYVHFVFTNVEKAGYTSFESNGNEFWETLLLYPIPGTVVNYDVTGVTYTATDDGEGKIEDGNLAGTIDYTTGELYLWFETAPTSGSLIEVNYSYANEGTVELNANSCSSYA